MTQAEQPRLEGILKHLAIRDLAEILAEILHPNHFHFGHQGRAWVRLTEGRAVLSTRPV